MQVVEDCGMLLDVLMVDNQKSELVFSQPICDTGSERAGRVSVCLERPKPQKASHGQNICLVSVWWQS